MPNEGQMKMFTGQCGQTAASEAALARHGRECVPVVLWLLDNTKAKAVELSTGPECGSTFWVPRSLISEDIKTEQVEGHSRERWSFTLPRWKVREMRLEGIE